jgi:HEAT repeat protein
MNGKIMRRLATAAVLGLVLFSGLNNGKTDGPGADPAVEFLSTDLDIQNTVKNGAPSAIWEVLEHGERTECLDCLSVVAPLLYDNDPHNREIAAWWIRRRPFGYYEIASGVRDTLVNDSDATRRAKAANALGEFLDGGATKLLVTAATTDADPGVRAASINAIARINDSAGATAISAALKDGDAGVRKAAVNASMHVMGFSDAATVATLLSDPQASIRTAAADALALFKAKGSTAALLVVASKDTSEDARAAAVNAIGEIGDATMKAAVAGIAANDASPIVRSAANIAGQKLALL